MALRDFQSFLPLGLHRAAPVLRIMNSYPHSFAILECPNPLFLFLLSVSHS